MTSEEIVEKIKTDQGKSINSSEVNLGDSVIFVGAERIHDIAEYLKNDPDLDFDYLSNITGTDYLNEEREPRFEVVYELHSIEKIIPYALESA